MVYLPVVGLILVCQTLFLVIARNRGLIREEVTAEDVRAAHQRNLIGLFYFMLGTVPGALPFGWIATGICVTAAIAIFILYKRA